MLDKKEYVIMAHLRSNARQKLTDISRKTSIPVSTIYDKLKRKNGVIKRHTALLDFDRLGYSTRANFTIKVSKKDKDALREFLMRDQKINSLFRINNGYDFLGECIFSSIKELDEYFELVEKRFEIEKKEIYYIVDDVKREAFLSDPDSFP